MPEPLEGQFSDKLENADSLKSLAETASIEQQRLEEITALRSEVERLKSDVEWKDKLIDEQHRTVDRLADEGREKDRRIAELEKTNRLQRDKLDALGAMLATLQHQLKDARERDADLSAQLSQADELIIELQQVIKGFESKAVFEWPEESKLSPELRRIIIGFLEQGDMGGLENLLDRLIRYDDKLPTLLKHTYFKEKVEEIYGRYFKRVSGPARRAADTAPGIPLSGPSGLTTMGVGPSASTLGILFIDLDDFKKLNDTKGHLVGDAALKRVAEVLNETLRQVDIKGRFGGEELEVAVELESPADGMKVAQKVVDAIRSAEISYEGETYRVTASVGIAELQPGEDLKGLIGRANWAMKYAKHTGKNRFKPAELEEAVDWVAEMKAQGVQIPDA